MSSDPIVVMKRFEMKYIINKRQERFLRERLRGHMLEDRYGLTSIASLYYDTPDYRLIGASLEKPEFKEKLRLRSYGLAGDDTPVFLELKRKAYGIVYKRRVQTTVTEAGRFAAGETNSLGGGQIGRELAYFRDMYPGLAPRCLIIYDRTAFFEPDGDLRLTVDGNPRYRMDRLDLRVSMEGISLLGPGCSVLELKVQDAVPLWLCDILSEGGIYKTNFSKYGEAYSQTLRGDRHFREVS